MGGLGGIQQRDEGYLGRVLTAGGALLQLVGHLVGQRSAEGPTAKHDLAAALPLFEAVGVRADRVIHDAAGRIGDALAGLADGHAGTTAFGYYGQI